MKRDERFESLREAVTVGLSTLGELGLLPDSRKRAPIDNGKVLSAVTDALYGHWYCVDTRPKRLPSAGFPPNLVELYRAAHAGTYRWETGWRAHRVSTAGRVVAARGRSRRMLTTTDYITVDRPGLPPRPGDPLKVTTRRDTSRLLPGFWLTRSRAWRDGLGTLVRLYWNVSIPGAVSLVRGVSERLDDDVPWGFKLPSEVAGFDRADVAVLYCPTSAFSLLAPSIADIHREVVDELHTDTPRLTKQLARGLAVAEDPTDPSTSFGQHRCRLLAEALIEAGRNAVETDAIVQMIHDQLRAAGIPPERPYVNGTDSPEYELRDGAIV